MFLLFRRTDSTAIDKSNITDDAATPSKKLKPSPTSNLAVNPPSQPSTPTFHQIANNSLLQRSTLFIIKCFIFIIN